MVNYLFINLLGNFFKKYQLHSSIWIYAQTKSNPYQ